MLNPIQKEFHADLVIEAREDNYPFKLVPLSERIPDREK